MRVLVVEDDDKIAAFISDGLRQAGFIVSCAADGEDGLCLASTEVFDAAVVDLMLPKLDGLGLIEQLRGQAVNIPVIILSARRSVDDRIRGLQAGGDDYMVKPFAFSELLARIHALLRRASDIAVAKFTQLTFANLSINLLSREVFRDDLKLDLQARAFALLEYLMRNPKRVVSKTMILEHVWDYSFDPQTNVVDVLICRLRNKVNKNFSRKIRFSSRPSRFLIIRF